MGRGFTAIQRSERCRLSRLVAIFRAPVRLKHRHFPRAEAGHPAIPIASCRGDCTDESAEDQSNHRRAVSRSENRGESCERDRCESRGLFAIPGRPAGNGQLRKADRHPRLATGRGAEIVMWEVMFWPIVACVLLPWLLVYLGLHVVQRGIIFIVIAMAQMASLGICLAVLFHLDLQSLTTFGIALGFTLVGGAIFSVTGKRSSQIPQEAVIEISYVVAAAAAVLLLSRAAEGDEEIKNMLVGNILLVTPHEVWKCFALFVAVGVFHFILRRSFLLVSFDRDGAYQKGLRVRWWDFLFYAVFGLVVTSFVRIAGVLLVFSYLIVPAICGINLAQRIGIRLLIAWLSALVGGVAGLFLSYWWDLPSGAAIVCTFGALLILISLFALWQHRRGHSVAAQDSQ